MFATQCASGFVAIKGLCVSCPTGASACSNAVTVTTCAAKFYEETINSVKQCTPCTAGAATCTSATAHTLCLEGFSKVGSATTCA